MGGGRSAIDMAGMRVGRLVVISRAENTASSKAQWVCRCDCGKIKIIARRNLIGETRSCGCLARELSSERRRGSAQDPAARVMAQIQKHNGCWIYGGLKDRMGYGIIRARQKNLFVHRVMYERHIGPIGDLCVLHKCDVPACCNPEHLFLGTRADNAQDKVRKRRQKYGAAVVGAKLNDSMILGIRRRAAEGMSQSAIGREYGVSQSVVCEIIARKRWKHVP